VNQTLFSFSKNHATLRLTPTSVPQTGHTSTSPSPSHNSPHSHFSQPPNDADSTSAHLFHPSSCEALPSHSQAPSMPKTLCVLPADSANHATCRLQFAAVSLSFVMQCGEERPLSAVIGHARSFGGRETAISVCLSCPQSLFVVVSLPATPSSAQQSASCTT
jgi:hypothetical protein